MTVSVEHAFQATGHFYDDEHFPYGFSRSGYFTRSQVELLERFGQCLKQLDEGLAHPANDEQQKFVAVCRGESSPSSVLEQTWLRYKQSLPGKRFVSLVDVSGVSSDSDSSSSDFDDD